MFSIPQEGHASGDCAEEECSEGTSDSSRTIYRRDQMTNRGTSPGGTTELRFQAMTSTYHSLNVHCVFTTRDREPWITSELEGRLWSFMAGILRKNGVTALCIGGVADHVHALISMPTTISVAKAVQLMKGGSSKWIHDTFRENQSFAWQEGYGAFSVSVSHIASTIAYIHAQREHHRNKTFQEEYLAFLKKHKIVGDVTHLWR